MYFHLYLQRSAVALACACAYLPLTAVGQSSDIETITVTGSRLQLDNSKLAAAVTVLNEQEIRQSGALQLTDLLRGLPGVSIAQSGSPGSLAELRLRGSESNHLLVLIDGVIANDIGQGGLIDLAHLTTEGVVKIELLRGPQSALWGAGAVAGVLSITTTSGRSSGKTPSAVRTHIGVGNRSTERLSLNSTWSREQTGINAFVQHLQTDGDNVARQGNEADGYRNTTLGVGLSHALNLEHKVTADIRLVDYENAFDAVDFAISGLPIDANNITKGEQLSANINWVYSPRANHYSSQMMLAYRSDRNQNFADGNFSGGGEGERLQLTWIHRLFDERNQWALGAEFLQRLFTQEGPVTFADPNQRQHDTAHSLFSEWLHDASEDISTSLSIRYDKHSLFDNALSYRAGVNWQLTRAASTYLSHGRAIKTPTFTEIFGFFPSSFQGNPDLVPEQNDEWELGLRFRPHALWSAELALFNANLEREILGFVFDPTSGNFTAQNADGTSQRQGVEGSWQFQGQHLNARVHYTYLDARQPSVNGQQVELRRARHQGSVSMGIVSENRQWDSYVKLAYTGSRFDTFFPPFPQPPETQGLRPYTLVSANVQFHINEHWTVGMRVDNALDHDFEDIVGFQGEQRRVLFNLFYH